MADDEDESLTKQITNMLWENNAVFFYGGAWLLYNLLVIVLLVYIAIRLTVR